MDPGVAPSRAGAGLVLLERDREVAALGAALDGAVAGRGGCLLVHGSAGIGKSRLLEVARSLAGERGMGVMRARGTRLEGDFAFGVAEQLLEPALAGLDPVLRGRLLARDDGGAAALFPRWAPERASAPASLPVVDGELAPDPAHPLLRTLAAIFAELVAVEPRAVFVGDAQWADAASLRFLHYLARRLEGLPALIVLGARPRGEWASPALYDALIDDEVGVLHPGALSMASTAALLEALLGRAVEAGFADAARRVTGGNPLFLRELAAELRHRGIEPSAARAGALAAIGPEGIARSVRVRLANAGPAAVAVARVAAVLDEDAPVDLIAQLAGLPASEAASAVDRLAAIGIFSGGGRAVFVHAILGAAVGDGIAAGERAALHARAAALLRERGAAGDAIAAHVALAEPGTCDGAVEVLRDAARRAFERGAPDVAAGLLRRALDEPLAVESRLQHADSRPAWAADARQPPATEAHTQWAESQPRLAANVRQPPTTEAHTQRAESQPRLAADARQPPAAELRPRLLLELGRAEALQRDPRAAAHLAEALAAARDADDRVLAALALWSTYSFDGRVSEGLEMLRETLAGETDADPSLRLRLELELARAARSCRPTAAEGRRRIAALAAAPSGGSSSPSTSLERLALGLVAYDGLLANRPVGEVVALVERALPLRDPVLGGSGSQLLHPPHYTLIWCDELDAARRMLGALIDDGRRRGSAIEVVMGSVWRAMAHLRAGAVDEAEEDARLGLAGSQEHGWRFGACASRMWLAAVALERGQLDVAGALHDENAVVVAGDVAQKGWVHHVRYERARWLIERGDAAEARDELAAIGRLQEQFDARCPAEMPWRSQAARAAMRLGDHDGAYRLAAEEVELARAFGAPRAIGVALRVGGAARRGAAGIALAEEAVAVLAASPARLEHARALGTLGELLRADGQVKAARTPLRAALDGALRCGATALAERVRSELIVTGARPRRTAVTGVEALTAAERRVVDLAAHGAGNVDVAQALFLSRKTVETHLSSAYRKLGIASRHELAAALERGRG